MSSPSRKRLFQELTFQSNKNNSTNFPTLFNLSIQTCISNLHIYATLDGLSFYPFGQALYSEFIKRSNQWRLTTEQRQAGIILFSESFGEFLGSEYTGLRCSLPQDITYLSCFAECLVYLDLSGGGFSNSGGQDGDTPLGFSDKDMAGLSALSQLRILNLSQLNIGDIGLSHLVRSVTYGSFGPAQLEYLNLSGTRITDAGLEKIFDGRNQKSLVFKTLLGIDLTDSKVEGNTAEKLFQTQFGPWKRIEKNLSLFPKSPSNKASKYEKDRLYLESPSGLNPMQKWIDCFSSRSFKIAFGQKPDLSPEGDGSWGLSECLAISKLGEVYFHPVSEDSLGNQQEFWNSREEAGMGSTSTIGKRSRSKRSRYIKSLEETLSKAANIRQQQPDLEHMYNLKMYQRVLNSIRETAGSLTLSKYQKTKTIPDCLAFVRSKAHVEKLPLDLGDSNNDAQPPPKYAFESKKTLTAIASNAGTARIRDRHSRTTASMTTKVSPFSSPPLLDHKILATNTQISSRNIFSKHTKGRHLSPFIKNEPATPSFSIMTSNSIPVKEQQRVFSANSKYCPPPFVKPISEQVSSKIYVTKQEQSPIPQSTSLPTKSLSTLPKKKQTQTSAGLMERWVTKQSQNSNSNSSLNSIVPCGDKRALTLPTKTVDSNIVATSNSGNIIREFHFTDEANKTVNLQRWIQSGSTAREGEGVRRDNSESEATLDKRPRKVIRFDPKNKLFNDGDTSLGYSESYD
ncbi:hypothetical protein BGZ76_007842 [Entomortierella beljakovae]|nr:hypothetical protein BGZ76_007842 [Entomortierella beljakovae]